MMLIGFIMNFIASPIFGNMLATITVLTIIDVLYRIHVSTKNNIDFSDLLINSKTGKIGGSEFRVNIAFLATTWALIFLTLKGSLTEWYVAAYLTAFVADRVFSRSSSIKDNTNDGNKKGGGADGSTTDTGSTNNVKDQI
jgi:hypothetical protein